MYVRRKNLKHLKNLACQLQNLRVHRNLASSNYFLALQYSVYLEINLNKAINLQLYMHRITVFIYVTKVGKFIEVIKEEVIIVLLYSNSFVKGLKRDQNCCSFL